MLSNAISFLRDHLFTMPVLAKFAVGMVMLVVIPRLSRRLHIPVPVGLLLSGVIVGPYVLDIFGKVRPIADFLAELGKLLLMFFAGLEINLELFRRARNRSIALGIATTIFPLLLGTIVGLAFGYAAIPAIVIATCSGVLSDSLTGVGDLYPLVKLKWNQGGAYQPHRREDSLAELAIFMRTNFRPTGTSTKNPRQLPAGGSP